MRKTKNWEYSPAPESTDHIKLKKQYDLFINGEFVPGVEGRYFDTINPSNEEKIAEVAEAGKADIDKEKTAVVMKTVNSFNIFIILILDC